MNFKLFFILTTLHVLLQEVAADIDVIYNIFNPGTPKTIRGIVGEVIEIPCGSSFIFEEIQLIKYDGVNERIISEKNDARVTTRQEHDVDTTHYWTIYNASKSDAGYYECLVNNLHASELTVEIIELPNELQWNNISTCGYKHLINGQPAECDPLGPYPCCGPLGRCGFTRLHCECDDCIDYRKTVAKPSITSCPGEYELIDGKCLYIVKSKTSWQTAANYCRLFSGKLAFFPNLDEVRKLLVKMINKDLITKDSMLWVAVTKDAPGTTNCENVPPVKELMQYSVYLIRCNHEHRMPLCETNQFQN